jgi:sRNA-binding carbon storage regulator CsrA
MLTRLKIDLKVGESIKIGDLASITMVEKSGQLARLDIKADQSVKIEHVRINASSVARAGLTVKM